MRQGEDRARLRHSITGKDIDAARHRAQSQHLGQRRASDHHRQAAEIRLGARRRVQQHEQDRRHAMGEGHALVLDQLQEQIRDIAPRIDLLGARGGRGVGEPPGMDMEHRGDRHVDAFAVKAALLGRHSERREFADRVQNHLPMAEIDALRRPGRPAGVKRRGLRVLVEIGEVVFGRSRRQHVFIVTGDALFAQDERVVVRHDDDGPDLRQAGPNLCEKAKEFVVDQQGRRARMFDRVDDLFMRQTDVHRLQNGAHHRDGEKRLQKPMACPNPSRRRCRRGARPVPSVRPPDDRSDRAACDR